MDLYRRFSPPPSREVEKNEYEDAFCLSLNLSLVTGVIYFDWECIISENCYCSYNYAKEILKGRFELGEESISKDCYFSFRYAKNVLKGRFELGEMVISESGYFSCDYAVEVIGGRFRLGEESIMKNPYGVNTCDYLVSIIGYDHE